MNLEQIFTDKTIKAKAKVAAIGEWLIDESLKPDELIVFAEKQTAVNKATCIESFEYATKKQPGLADENLWDYVSLSLKNEEPRVKWESAKVIGNVARLFEDKLDKTIKNLLANTENNGTVVRWATAYALAEIIKLKTEQNKKLVPKIEALCEKEEDNGVKKKYLDALKKIKK